MALNGVKQGAMLSSVLFSIYTDGLLISLPTAGTGCHIGHKFVSALAYADDLVFLAPIATAMRKLLAIHDDFALQYSISFNTFKAKWLAKVTKSCHLVFSKVNECSFLFFKQ
jgi:hypothetical protein